MQANFPSLGGHKGGRDAALAPATAGAPAAAGAASTPFITKSLEITPLAAKYHFYS